MTTQRKTVYGLTGSQVDQLREDRLSRRPPAAAAPGAYNLQLVEIVGVSQFDASGQRRVYPGRLVTIQSGVATRGARVWVRNPAPQLGAGFPTSPYDRLTANALRCRMYSAVYTEDAATANAPDGSGAYTAPVYTAMSTQAVRFVKLTAVYDAGVEVGQYSWIELDLFASQGQTQNGLMSGACQAGAMAVTTVSGHQTLTVSGSTGSYYATWNGVPLGTFDLAAGSTPLATAIAAITTGATIGVVGFVWTVTASGSNTLTAVAIPRYPAFNLAANQTPGSIAAMVNSVVQLTEGWGSYPSVTIEQTAWGRTDISTPAVSEVTFEGWVGGNICVTVWQTATGASADCVFAATGGSIGLAAALNASGFPVTFTVTGSGVWGDPFIVTATGDYQDYGLVWNQAGADGWGTMEFAFTADYAQSIPPVTQDLQTWVLTSVAGVWTWVVAAPGTTTVNYVKPSTATGTLTFTNGVLTSSV